MSLRHCLDCDRLTPLPIRCIDCKRRNDRALSAAGRQRRGPNWSAKSKQLRLLWASIGLGCMDAADGNCRGKIQADHVIPGQEIFAPRCAYHNAKKGRRVNSGTR